jgi:hypothetical protein
LVGSRPPEIFRLPFERDVKKVKVQCADLYLFMSKMPKDSPNIDPSALNTMTDNNSDIFQSVTGSSLPPSTQVLEAP